MFHSPFGSIFSSDTNNRLGFLSDQSKSNSIEAEEIAVPEIVQETPAVETESNKPDQPIKLENKQPFSVLPPQFQAATTMRSDDPKVKAEQSKIIVEKNKQKLAAINRRLNDLKVKIKSAQVYRDVLVQYNELKGTDKDALDGWIDLHSDAIKKLTSARKLKTIEKTNKEAAKALDAEIKHWENLVKLKEQGADVKGKTILKTFRPTTSSVPASPKETGPVPTFTTKAETSNIVRLKQKVAKSSELRGFDASDEAVKNLVKEPKKSYKDLFVEQLPSRNFVLEKRTMDSSLTNLVKKTENTMVLAKQYEWRIDRANDEFTKLSSEYRNLQENLSDITSKLSSDPNSTKTINSLGILLEARPERFLSSPTLIQASKDAFTRLSQLGDTETKPQSPEVEANILLKETAESSAASLTEVELRQNTLEQLKAKVDDKPAPPPIQISVEVVTKPAPIKQTASFLNKVLPWVAILLILHRLLRDK